MHGSRDPIPRPGAVERNERHGGLGGLGGAAVEQVADAAEVTRAFLTDGGGEPHRAGERDAGLHS